MSGTAEAPVSTRPGWVDWLFRRQLDYYPENRARVTYLAITVLATITLYYELYVGGSVSTLILANLNMSFTFFVLTLAFGALIGAFGSLFAGITDRLGRANLVVFGLFFTAEKVETYTQATACDVAAFNRFFHAMLDRGVYLAPSAFEAGFMSVAHSEQDIADTLDAARVAFRAA